MVNNSTTKRSVDLCVGLDVIIVGIMDAMAGTTAVAVDADVVITTDAVEEIPSVKASARDTGRATMMHCGTAAAAAVDAVVVVMAAVAAVLAAVGDNRIFSYSHCDAERYQRENIFFKPQFILYLIFIFSY